MAIKPPDENEAKKLILEYLPDNKSIPKETLLYNCAVAFLQKKVPDETERQRYMEDKTPGALWNKINCELGKVRKQLTTSGIIAENESGLITKNIKKDIDDDEAIEIQNIILELTSERGYTKKELLDSICTRYKAKKLKNLRSYAGQVLISLYENNELKKSDNNYYQDSPQKSRDINKKIINSLDSKVFESQVVTLFDRYYDNFYKSYKDRRTEITAGPDDGGIDGLITYNEFGYDKRIIIQVKHRIKGEYNCITEMKEFAGLLTADDAIKGYFVTNGKFTSKIQNFIKKCRIKELTCIDGEQLLDIADTCNFRFSDN